MEPLLFSPVFYSSYWFFQPSRDVWELLKYLDFEEADISES